MTKEQVPMDSAHGYTGPGKKSNKDEPKVLVRFRRSYPPWQPGEIAGFPETRAMELVKPVSKNLGGPYAELYVPPKMEED